MGMEEVSKLFGSFFQELFVGACGRREIGDSFRIRLEVRRVFMF